jgi:hypothetical protein
MEKYYFSGNWYGQASCGIIYILAIALERADNDLLWYFSAPSHLAYFSLTPPVQADYPRANLSIPHK